MKPVLIINGPNLNLLGVREPAVYGSTTLEQIEEDLLREAKALGVSLEFFQSNHEGALIDRFHAGRGTVSGALLNAGGLTHTSVSLRDAITGVGFPVVAVHLSNTLAREDFRRRDLIAPVCQGLVMGLGPSGYRAALRALVDMLRRP